MLARHAESPLFPARRHRRSSIRLALPAVLATAAVLSTACGGSSSDSSGGGSSSGPTTVKTATVTGYGKALVTNSGQSVYVLSTDPPGASKCVGTCAKTWTPLTVSGSPSAGAGVDSSKLSTFKRKDGTTQVAYDKHALYTYSSPGATSGEGVASQGGTWYLIAPSSKPITQSTTGNY